jgi:tetratricopeptide (TPR) repeat protein
MPLTSMSHFTKDPGLFVIKDSRFKLKAIAILIVVGFGLNYVLPGAEQVWIFVFIALFLSSKYFVAVNYVKGKNLVKGNRFEEAISEFETSFNSIEESRFFSKYLLLDIFYSPRSSIQQFNLMYIGYCYYKLGEEEKTTEQYAKLISLFPKGFIAKKMQNLNLEDKTS